MKSYGDELWAPDGDRSFQVAVPLASHAGVFRGVRFLILPACSTENNIPFPLF